MESNMTNKLIHFEIKILHHFLFWFVYFFLNFLRWGSYFNDYWYSLKSNLIEFSLIIPLVYFNLFVLVPKLILRSKYILYIFALLCSLLLLYLMKTGLTYFLISKNIWPEANREYHSFDINHIVAVVIGELYVVGMATSVYFTLYWLKERERNRALSEEQLKIKVRSLELQIQPHFFFNTLNNLYALSLSKSELVAPTIIKLSKLMKHLIYDIKESNTVLMTKELDYIQNYIDIEKLRFKNIEVRTNINTDLSGIVVPPMIFINFVENAFKHGGFNDIFRIKINCSLKNKKYLTFEVINNFDPSKKKKIESGIGNENVLERLHLLFGKEFQCQHSTKLNYYIAKLEIPINYEEN